MTPTTRARDSKRTKLRSVPVAPSPEGVSETVRTQEGIMECDWPTTEDDITGYECSTCERWIEHGNDHHGKCPDWGQGVWGECPECREHTPDTWQKRS